MTRGILAAALATALSGCSAAPALKRPLPDYSAIHSVARERRAFVYVRLEISDIKDTSVKIGGLWYNAVEFSAICRDLNAEEAQRYMLQRHPHVSAEEKGAMIRGFFNRYLWQQLNLGARPE